MQRFHVLNGGGKLGGHLSRSVRRCEDLKCGCSYIRKLAAEVWAQVVPRSCHVKSWENHWHGIWFFFMLQQQRKPVKWSLCEESKCFVCWQRMRRANMLSVCWQAWRWGVRRKLLWPVLDGAQCTCVHKDWLLFWEMYRTFHLRWKSSHPLQLGLLFISRRG